MCPYSVTENGFSIRVDMTVHPREAVMKALYRFHDDYIISFERDGCYLLVWFETHSGLPGSKEVIAEVLKELSYQTIRYDTMQNTKGVRELLVARALYATCIDNSDDQEMNPNESSSESWLEDKKSIFKSWSSQE